MNYLITGSGGQLGQDWVRYARRNNLNFTAVTSSGLDITDKEKVHQFLKTEKPDVVINCAAYTKVDQAETETEKAFAVNADGVKHLAESCRTIGALLVHYSTDYVFAGNLADRDTYPRGYTEEAPRNPSNIYGKSKHTGEIALIGSGTEYLLIRVSWLCGRYGSNFVKTMLRLVKEREEVSVVNDQFGSPSFAFDVVEKTDALIRNNLRGTYHISSNGELAWADFADQVFQESGTGTSVKQISSEQFAAKAKRPAYSLLCNKKMEKAGIKPLDWKDGLSRLMKQLNEDENLS